MYGAIQISEDCVAEGKSLSKGREKARRVFKLPLWRSKRKFRFMTSQEKCAIHFSQDQGQNQVSVRNLMLFTVMLACLVQPAISIAQDSKSQPSDETVWDSKSADFNGSIYYKNDLAFSLETGWRPI